jgi:peptide-methionine (S)-S-oxide reductase
MGTPSQSTSWPGLALALLMGLAALAAVSSRAATPAGSETKPSVAIFAGGCFWCVEDAFDEVPGVVRAVSGYTGGTTANPTYEQVSSQGTGHFEAVQVSFDARKVSYAQLVDWFWRNIDPVDAKGQFCDKGSSYRSAIFYGDDAQRSTAEASKAALQASGRIKGTIATLILPAGPFYPAEEYHQGYAKKSPFKYQYYKQGCGRAQRLQQIWGPPAPPQTQ